MKIDMAHVRTRSTTGGWIDYALFNAKSTNGDNDGLLARLTGNARNSGLKVDQSALVYSSGGRNRFYGSRHLVDHLARHGMPNWTHEIDL
ncbi:hypothetical protein ACTACL_11830 [Pseudomonas syringae]|nr:MULTISPECIES: hypothetical protein [Pseudomonas syringae group]AVI87367.1 hypothetical protein XJ28_28500 [Pseudomonas syringae pv. tomato]QBI60852.1 hypothetical protein EIZ61_04780 [Pseudomonas syringae]TES58522.1 hypothetical protein E2N91_14110 [Pseudomonas syringae pv. tomato]TES72354.1 hypothetical protein E2N89_29285 [Pseudomonas syringae pv. tomato]